MRSTNLMLVAILTWPFTESNPVCESNMKDDGYVGLTTCQLTQEDMIFTCALSFEGQPSQLTWTTLNGSQSFNSSTCKTENGRINCSLSIKADSKYDGTIFKCQTTNSSVNCSTEVIKIQYFESQSVAGNPPLVVKNMGDKVNCSVKSNQQLQFKWTLLQGGDHVTVIKNQELLIQSPGFYKCVVEYSVRNAVCVADESEVNALTPSTTHCDCSTDREATTIYKEVLVNATTNITCIPNEDIQIQWHHTGPSRSSSYLYAGERFYDTSNRGFRLLKDSNTGPYHLVIPHARAEDAGLYECKEDATGSRVFGSTELTVLESSPICESNMKPEGYVGPNTCKLEPEDMTFTCAVSFKGKPPQMTWQTLNGSQTFSESTCRTTNCRKNCSLIIRADSKYDGSIFNCQLRNLSVNCSKEIIKIQYFESQKSPVVMKSVSDKVNCSVKSNQKLEFKWALLQGNQYVTVDENQELLIQIPGFYKCVVEYSFRNSVCVADGSEVIALTPSTIYCETGQAKAAAISATITFIIVIIGLVLWFRTKICESCKNKCGGTNNDPGTNSGGAEIVVMEPLNPGTG